MPIAMQFDRKIESKEERAAPRGGRAALDSRKQNTSKPSKRKRLYKVLYGLIFEGTIGRDLNREKEKSRPSSQK
jgi:hypothetical protein